MCPLVLRQRRSLPTNRAYFKSSIGSGITLIFGLRTGECSLRTAATDILSLRTALMCYQSQAWILRVSWLIDWRCLRRAKAYSWNVNRGVTDDACSLFYIVLSLVHNSCDWNDVMGHSLVMGLCLPGVCWVTPNLMPWSMFLLMHLDFGYASFFDCAGSLLVLFFLWESVLHFAFCSSFWYVQRSSPPHPAEDRMNRLFYFILFILLVIQQSSAIPVNQVGVSGGRFGEAYVKP